MWNGTFVSFSRMALMNGMTDAIFGRSLGAILRFGAAVFFSAARTVRR
jgi:hypothetical protein